ncbi:MAG: glycosyltransferase family 61 protein [Magnetococcus sp. MYC-9]
MATEQDEGRFVETVLCLDANDDHDALMGFLRSRLHDPNAVFAALHLLVPRSRLYTAYLLARLLADAGFRYPIIFFTLSLAGLVYGQTQALARGLAGLREEVDRATEEGRATFYAWYIAPVLTHAMTVTFQKHDSVRMAYGFEILKASVPRFREILPEGFGWSAPVPHLSAEAMAERGHRQARWLNPPLPADGTPRRHRRVVLVQRAWIFREQIWPRPRAVEARLAAAMEGYGWQVTVCSLPGREPRLEEEYRTIATCCRRQDAELLLLDEGYLFAAEGETDASRLRGESLSLLRLQLPALKVATLLLDARSTPLRQLTERAPGLDLILDPGTPGWPVWDDPLFAGKVLHLPIPQGDRSVRAEQPLTSSLCCMSRPTLYGGFWLQAAGQVGLPVRSLEPLRDPGDDLHGESHLRYRHALAAESCLLDLAEGPHQAGSVTDSCFAAILGGSLLVKECSPHMHHYFIPGVHYLEFSSLVDLAAISRFIAGQPAAAEAIRQAGCAFARQHYSDAALIGRLDRALVAGESLPGAQPPSLPFHGAALAPKLRPYVHVSVERWCRLTERSELLAGTGNLFTYCHEVNPPQPELPLPDLQGRGEGFEMLIPCDERFIGATMKDFDLRSRRLITRPPFVARLENVRVEFPGFGLFLDRHLVMAESYHDREELQASIDWCSDSTRWLGMRRTGSCDLTLNGLDGRPTQGSLELNCYWDRAVDQYEEGPVILLSSPARANYHHWMVETLPRLWCLTAVPELRSLPLLVREPLLPFQTQTLAALGIPPERLRRFTGNLLQVETLIFPSFITPAHAHGNGSLQHMNWLRNALLPAFGVDAEMTAPHRLLYISRKKSYRGFLNEEQVASGLQSRGFEVLCLEELPLREQMQAFAHARMVVMPHGAAGVNMLFVQPGTLYIELMPATRQNAIHLVHAAVRRCHSGCILCDYANPVDQSMVVHVESLLKVVDHALMGIDRAL